MYNKTKRILASKVLYPSCVESQFDRLPTNGKYIRGNRGYVLGTFKPEDNGIFYMADCDGEIINGNITDNVLVDRISDYFDNLYGKYSTNCAALANFLFTGRFIEYKSGSGLNVVQCGMRPYSMTERVEVGDMLCIVYGNKQYALSRRYPEIRKKFVKARAKRKKSGSFAACVRMKEKSFSPDEVRHFCLSPLCQDYHFMTCVGHYDKQPVWLSQMGYHNPGSNGVAVVLTWGEYDPYRELFPLMTMIKKRR